MDKSMQPFPHPGFIKCNSYPSDLLGEYPSYEAVKVAIKSYLIGLAKTGGKCTFRTLYSSLCLPLYVTYSFHRKLIGEICSEINGEEYAAGRPLIGVLLCSESDGYITGKGFFDLMQYPEFCEGFPHGLDKEIKQHRAAFFGIHAQKCWLYWHKRKKAEEKAADEGGIGLTLNPRNCITQ